MDLRGRIIAALQLNEATQTQIARQFSVSRSCVEKLWQRFRATGSYAPLPPGGGRTRLLRGAEVAIRQGLDAQPDLTLQELADQVVAQTHTAPVSASVLCAELQRLSWPRKKESPG